MVSAGRVLIMPKGAYDATETYSMLDLVSYNGSSYVAKKSTTGNLPTNTTYWQLSAYGGSASNIAGNFATLETTDYASQNYAVGDYLVTKDSQLCEVIATITTGDELVLDTNIEVTSVEAMIEGVKDYVDDLDVENVKLKGMTAISVQTDLDTMTTLGNYYKASGSFYVTNAPTGIDSEITALFRLTVENGSDSTDKYLQTLITNDGKTYKRGYDGSDWSDWIEFSTAAVAATKQPKTLETPIIIGGTSQTTVEAALGALEDAKADTTVTDSLSSSITTLTNQTTYVKQKVSDSGDEYSSSIGYGVGQYVIHDNKLYECITACSPASWAVNSSCFAQSTLTHVVSYLSRYQRTDITINSNYGTGTFTFFRRGSMVLVTFDITITTVPSGSVTVATIPAGFRPYYGLTIAAVPYASNETSGAIGISSNGEIHLYGTKANCRYLDSASYC